MRSAIDEPPRSSATVLRNFKKDGTEFRNELFMFLVEDDGGEVAYFVGVQNTPACGTELVDDLGGQRSGLEGVFEASPVALGWARRGSVWLGDAPGG